MRKFIRRFYNAVKLLHLPEDTSHTSPILDMMDTEKSADLEYVSDIQSSPHFIGVEVDLHPVEASQGALNTTFHMHYQGLDFKPIPLYPTTLQEREAYYVRPKHKEMNPKMDPPSICERDVLICSHINLVFKGEIWSHDGGVPTLLTASNSQLRTDLKPGDVLFKKAYASLKSSVSFSLNYADDANISTSLLEAKDALPIFGYGGFYKKGGLLESFQQLYFQGTVNNERLLLNVTNTDNWMAQGIVPPKFGFIGPTKICFVAAPSATQSTSLAETISSGLVRIHLKNAQDDDGVSVAYHSYGYKENYQKEGQLLILLKKYIPMNSHPSTL
jgi:hypothetical protein